MHSHYEDWAMMCRRPARRHIQEKGTIVEEAFEAVALEAGDMNGLTVRDVVCVDCIKGFCPARTPARFEEEEFILCGAKKAVEPVLAAYQHRTGRILHIEKPC